jgi:hypothetical protein
MDYGAYAAHGGNSGRLEGRMDGGFGRGAGRRDVEEAGLRGWTED